jgi:hypothetical protein
MQIQSRAMPLRVQWFYNGHRVDIEHASALNSAVQSRRFNVQDEKVGLHELISRLTINEFGKTILETGTVQPKMIMDLYGISVISK